jgi:hypothetical protein
MTEYMVLLPDDEKAWESATEEQRQQMYGVHRQFAQLLEERGHKFTGGSELAPSREAKTLRTSADGTTTITDGPYAETVEQLTGFYLIETDDLDGLLDTCKVLAQGGERAIEVRALKSSGS